MIPQDIGTCSSFKNDLKIFLFKEKYRFCVKEKENQSENDNPLYLVLINVEFN